MISVPRTTGPALFLCSLLLSPGPAGAAGPAQVRDWLSDHQTDLYGFVDVRNGWRLQEDPYEKDASLAEVRAQLDLTKYLDWGTLKFKGDLVGDAVTEEVRGELRELNLLFSPFSFMDVKAGRQILTWGTGDLLFVNDLFPKDWQAFFSGREVEYLKAPSDAVKVSLFSELLNADLVYVPVFNNSNYIDGERLSYWNPLLGRTAGRDFIFADEERNQVGNDAEYALRFSKTVGSTEWALYGYYGFWKTPEGLDPLALRLTYPRLAVYGASVRRPVLGGIGNLEAGYYDSLDDQSGADPLVRNSEIRFLAGYERELGRNLTGGFQYYLEYKQDYGAYRDTLPPRSYPGDEYRHVLTVRLTKLLLRQTLALSLFTYYSPSDDDAYLRPYGHYKLTDQWGLEAGANIFVGANDHTFFGQFEDNTNLYAGVRYSF